MRKQFLLLLILCLTASMAWAEQIDVATARKVAESVARREGSTGGLRSAGELPLVYAAAPGQSGSALRSGAMEGAADYFVFNFPGGKGFAIVAGDDRVRPVLGYSDEGGFDPDNLPENLRGWLAGYQTQITWAVNKGIEATPEIAAEWSQLMSGTALRATQEPVLLNTARWNQGEPYNRQTPVFDTEHAVTGCVATALGIVMRYHEYPDIVTSDERITSYYQLPVTYEAYDWSKMPLVYAPGYSEEEANAVAALMWNIGANVEMDYGIGGSGAITSNAILKLNTVFGYSEEAQFVWKSDYRWAEWKQMVRAELDNGRPVIYSGYNTKVGHAFICDGYKENEAFHINWGWGGSGNGYFLLTALDSDSGDDPFVLSGMGIGIRPPEAGDTKPHTFVYTHLTTDNVPVGSDFYISVRGINRGVEPFTITIDMAIIAADGTIKQRIGKNQLPGEVQVGYSKSGSILVQLSEALASGEVIRPVYSDDGGTTWKVMSGSADAPLYINMTGVVMPESDDPGDPEIRPVNVSLRGNLDSYLGVNEKFTEWFYYSVTNGTEDLLVRYTLKDYGTWKDVLTMSYQNPDGTTDNEVTSESFEIKISPEHYTDGYFSNVITFHSTREGDLPWEVQVSTASNPSEILLHEEGTIRFIQPLVCNMTPAPIMGKAGEKISFSLSYSPGIDSHLQGKRLQLYYHIYNLPDSQEDDVKVYYIGEDGTEQELRQGYSFDAGVLKGESPYTFKISSSTEIPLDDNVRISLSAMVDGYSIPCKNQFADVIISNTPIKTYPVSWEIPGLYKSNNITQMIPGKQDITLNLYAQKGFRLPTSVVVNVAGQPLSTGFYYNPESGYLYISKEYITGPIEIEAIGVSTEKDTYTVKSTFTNVAAAPSVPSAIQEGESLRFALSADKGYVLPSSITVTMGGNVLNNVYDPKTGVVEILSVTGDIVITAAAIPSEISFRINNFFDSKYLAVGEPVFGVISFASSDPDLNYRFVFTLTDPSDAANLKIVYGNENSISNPKNLSFDAQGKATILSQDCREDNGNFIAYMNVTAQGEKVSIPYSVQVYDETGTALYLEYKTAFQVTQPIRLSVDPIRGNLNKGNVPFTLNMTDAGSLAGQKANLSIRVSYHDDAALALVYDGKTTAFIKQENNTYLATLADFPLVAQKYAFKLIAKKPTAEDPYAPMVDFSLTDPEGNTLPVMGQSTAPLELYYEYTVKATLANMAIDGSLPQSLKPGETLAVTLKPAADYKLPRNITLKMAGVTLDTSRYTYNSSTGAIKLENVQGDVEIIANGVDDQHFEVTLQPIGVIFEPSSFDPILIKEKLTVKLTAEEGYELPRSISVTMGGTTLTAGEGYTYTIANGSATLEIAKVTGPVSIIAKATPKSYAIDAGGLKNLTSDIKPDVKVEHGKPFEFKLTAIADFLLPAEITISAAGKPLAIGTDYMYDPTSGIVKINVVKGNLTITAEAAPLPVYTITKAIENLSLEATSLSVKQGKDFEGTLKAVQGYRLPKAILVTATEARNNSQIDYTYDPATGKVSIKNVQANLTITAKAEKIPTYKAKLTLTGLTSNWDETKEILEGSVFECKLTAENGYKLPAGITVMVGGVLSSNYKYDVTAGTIRIENVKGAIEIIATGIDNTQAEVILNLIDLIADKPSSSIVQIDSKLTVRLTATSGYELPSTVKVEMGSKTLVVNNGYTYDAQKGIIVIEKVTDNVVITAFGNRIPEPEPEPEPEPIPTTYTVTLPVVEGATIAATGSTTITAGNDFSFIVEVKAGYNADNMVVKANGTTLTPDANGRYTVANIRSNVVVTVTGIVKGDDPTMNETINSDELRVWAANGRLHIQTPAADTAYIVTFDGRVYKTLSLFAGEYVEAMPQGSYIIYIGKQSYKLRF
ncbi:C10 family peptidase [Parabacteroides sp.]|uniref:C10 family peptidase n=1 Tax=Parabacteroides sp. TaxID=1869337 RepID=UPI00257EDFF3|nr:C10 family peptidase [Parabacteroides sp.]